MSSSQASEEEVVAKRAADVVDNTSATGSATLPARKRKRPQPKSTYPTELENFTFSMRDCLVLKSARNPKGKTEEELTTEVIVADEIIFRDQDDRIVFTQDLKSLNSDHIRILANRFGCKNVGSLTHFACRHVMAKKVQSAPPKTTKTSVSFTSGNNNPPPPGIDVVIINRRTTTMTEPLAPVKKDPVEELYGKISIGFMGAGMMATAIMDGLLAKGVVKSPNNLACSDPYDAALARATEKGIFASKSNVNVCNHVTDVIILAVKPNNIGNVCEDIMVSNNKDAVIISIAAGITLHSLEAALPQRKIIRVMPNTPCLVGQAASGYSLGTYAQGDERCTNLVKAIFGAVGIVLEIKEELLDAVTGLSGSGPAYVFEFIEALADGGVRVGLSRHEALQLAAQTVKGAAEMILHTGSHPAVLKDQVCSPGGTTIAGVDQLEEGGLRSTMIKTVKAATRRSLVLGGATDEQIARKFNL